MREAHSNGAFCVGIKISISIKYIEMNPDAERGLYAEFVIVLFIHKEATTPSASEEVPFKKALSPVTGKL